METRVLPRGSVLCVLCLAMLVSSPRGLTGQDVPPPGGIGPADQNLTEIAPTGRFQPGQRVDIAEGEIDVEEFLRFLSDYTGMPVFVDSQQLVTMKPITVVAPIIGADADIVKGLLEANRLNVIEKPLSNGRAYLKVESATTAVPASPQPEENKIVKVVGSDITRMEDDIDELRGIKVDEVATMVFTLRHIEPKDAVQSLQNLLGVTKKSSSFSIVEVQNSPILIITAKFGLINYFRKLLSIIDVPIQEPERIVQIIDVVNAYADELAQTIDAFLQQGTGGRRVGTTTTARPPGAAAASRISSAARRTSTQDYMTNVLPDARTNKLIVETYNEADLEDIFMLVRELDIRYELRRMKTHIYQVRYLKADEVAADLSSLLGASGFAGRTSAAGRRTSPTRTRSVSRVGTQATRSPAVQQPGAGPAGQGGPALIVPHIQTNSLLIQAEPEDLAEIIHVLDQIDTKRRQVFLEAALVQVTADSSLNYTIELLAGDPDDNATRGLFESSFGLSGIDLENFNRTIPDLSEPGSVPTGTLTAIMHRGKFPVLIHALKTHADSQVMATPFILADDNMPNVIQILETQFVQTTQTVNTATTTSQEAEDAGIILEITPTISSEDAVFLEMSLEVSQFTAQAAAGGVLPPKITNTITSAVTVPDGRLFVIGGLTRENKSKTVSKVPILGDIPLLGKIFRSEASAKSLSNLYIFLRAHVLTHPDFEDHAEITEQARTQVWKFAPDLDITNFEAPRVQDPPPPLPDPDQPRRFDLNPQARAGSGSRSTNNGYQLDRQRYVNDPESPYGPAGSRDGGLETPSEPVPRRSLEEPGPTPPSAPERVPETEVDTTPETAKPSEKPEPSVPKRPTSEEKRARALEGTGAEVDPNRKSWLVPLRRQGS